MEEVKITKTASINRNDNNEIIVDQEGYMYNMPNRQYVFFLMFIYMCVVCLFICVLLITVDYRWINF